MKIDKKIIYIFLVAGVTTVGILVANKAGAEQSVNVQVKNPGSSPAPMDAWSNDSFWPQTSYFVRTWDPFQEMMQMQTRIHQMFDDTLHDATARNQVSRASVYQPALDLVETSGEYVVTCDLPGIAKEDIEVDVKNQILSIRGERKIERAEEQTGEGYQMHWRERSYGGFARSVRLPEAVDTDRITAEYENGQLKVHLPKSAEEKPMKIKIM